MDDGSGSRRKEEKVAAMKKNLLKVAASLFAERGFYRTTTKELAEAAGVSEGTIYNYFENKESLLFGILEELADSEIQELQRDRLVFLDPRSLFEEALRDRKVFLDKNKKMLQALLSEVFVDPRLRERYLREIFFPYTQRSEEIFNQFVTTGQLKPIEVKYMMRVVMCVMTGLFFLDILGDPLIENDWQKVADTVVEVVFDGITPG